MSCSWTWGRRTSSVTSLWCTPAASTASQVGGVGVCLYSLSVPRHMSVCLYRHMWQFGVKHSAVGRRGVFPLHANGVVCQRCPFSVGWFKGCVWRESCCIWCHAVGGCVEWRHIAPQQTTIQQPPSKDKRKGRPLVLALIECRPLSPSSSICSLFVSTGHV